MGTSLAIQWLRLQASTAGGFGLMPGGELKSQVPHGVAKKKKQKTNKKIINQLGILALLASYSIFLDLSYLHRLLNFCLIYFLLIYLMSS